jgi:hypothetical protein
LLAGTCGGSLDHNISYVLNPNYPSGYSTTVTDCKFTIKKCATSVCQVRKAADVRQDSTYLKLHISITLAIFLLHP